MSRILTNTWLQSRTLHELHVLRGETLRALAGRSPARRPRATRSPASWRWTG